MKPDDTLAARVPARLVETAADPAAGPSATPAEAPLVVEINAVEKVFPNGTRALAPLTLQVREGELVTLLGPSGCGKSTLLNLIAGLSAPSAGRLRLWGAAPGMKPVGAAIGRKLAFVFQDATLMPWARVNANVRLPLDLDGMNRVAAEARVAQSLKMVGLEDAGALYPRQLSGGMKMRVSIARALATGPNLLLMDEPFGALDEITRNRLDADLIGLWWEKALTIVFVTHSIYEAVFLSTRVVVMAAGPGRITGEIVIDEPHPRTESFRVSDRFAAHCRRLAELLALASAGGDAGAVLKT
ncbi:MAG: ABC transporter ATP-binding protein [Betaproteobacteria bacterium]|nr:ABC transporter ATP-binding protein [Betaproteobacteria bacterium]